MSQLSTFALRGRACGFFAVATLAIAAFICTAGVPSAHAQAAPPPDAPPADKTPPKAPPRPEPEAPDPNKPAGGGIISSDIGAPVGKVPDLEDLPALVIPKRAGERALPRIAKQKLNKPFAVTTFGLDFQSYFAASDTPIELPLIGDSFHGVTPQSSNSLNLAIGGLHFFNRADLYISIPLVSFGDVPVEDTSHKREMTNTYLVAAGAKVYAMPLDVGKVRPYLALGLARRRWTLDPADETSASFEEARQWTVPFGIGVAYRSDFALIFDLSLQYSAVDSFTIYTGVHPQELKEVSPKFRSADIDLSSALLTFSVRWTKDTNREINTEEFRPEEAKKLGRLMRTERASGLTLQVGAGARLLANGSDYFDEHRPYIASSFAENPFATLAVGYYEFEMDIEARLAYRAFSGDAHGYGSSMKAGRHGFFLEAFKLIDIGFYGFVPWVGLGVGYELYDFTDVAPTKLGGGDTKSYTNTHDDSGVVMSVPFGFDMRTTPSAWWFLRTSFRWVPFANVDVAKDVTFDYGGLEFEFISLVIHPQRLMKSDDDD